MFLRAKSVPVLIKPTGLLWVVGVLDFIPSSDKKMQAYALGLTLVFDTPKNAKLFSLQMSSNKSVCVTTSMVSQVGDLPSNYSLVGIKFVPKSKAEKNSFHAPGFIGRQLFLELTKCVDLTNVGRLLINCKDTSQILEKIEQGCCVFQDKELYNDEYCKSSFRK